MNYSNTAASPSNKKKNHGREKARNPRITGVELDGSEWTLGFFVKSVDVVSGSRIWFVDLDRWKWVRQRFRVEFSASFREVSERRFWN